MGLLQRFCGLLPLGDVLNGAQHGHRLPVGVEFQAALAMHPPHLPVAVADDPVLAIEGRLFADDCREKVLQHRLALLGMDQLHPAVNRPLIIHGNAEDAVESRGARPQTGGHIEDIATQVGDLLGFEQAGLFFPQRLRGPARLVAGWQRGIERPAARQPAAPFRAGPPGRER